MQTQILSFFSSLLTVAAVAGLALGLAEGLGCLSGKGKSHLQGKLRYLCALAVIASLAAPLPGFVNSLKSALDGDMENLLSPSPQITAHGTALGGRLFTEAAASSLSDGLTEYLGSSLSLSGDDFTLRCTVRELSDPSPDEGLDSDLPSDPSPPAGTADRLFSISGVYVELHTLRGAANTERIRQTLAFLQCPLEIREAIANPPSAVSPLP